MNTTTLLVVAGGAYLLLKPSTAVPGGAVPHSVAPINLTDALKAATANNTSLANAIKALTQPAAKPAAGISSGPSGSVPSNVAPFSGGAGAVSASLAKWLQNAINPTNPFNQVQPIATPGTGLIDSVDAGTYDTPGLDGSYQTLAILDANAQGADISPEYSDTSGLTDSLDSVSVPDYQTPTMAWPDPAPDSSVSYDTSANGSLDSTYLDTSTPDDSSFYSYDDPSANESDMAE